MLNNNTEKDKFFGSKSQDFDKDKFPNNKSENPLDSYLMKKTIVVKV